MSSGLQRGTVQVVSYDEAWPDDFAAEQLVLVPIFGGQAVAIEHVGSTAVPSLSAKPIIDIEVGLRDFAAWRQFVPALEAAGYVFMPERVRDIEVFTPKGPEARRTHHLHLTQYAGSEWRRTLAFRDALRNDAGLLQEYQTLKQRLAKQYPDDRAAYTAGKAAFIRRVLES